MKLKGMMVIFLFYLGVSLGGISLGTPLDISGKDDTTGASFEGTVDYNDNELILYLKNTTDGTGSITGVGFFLPDDSMSASLTSQPDNFDELSGGGLKGYDAGAGTGKNLWGGGNPNQGLNAGEDGTFIFKITSDSILSGNVFANFLNESDFGVVRFQGIGKEGFSAKITTTPGGGAQVPEPATIFLLGSGLLGFLGYRKKFWKTKGKRAS